jgi:hypothetical protein
MYISVLLDNPAQQLTYPVQDQLAYSLPVFMAMKNFIPQWYFPMSIWDRQNSNIRKIHTASVNLRDSIPVIGKRFVRERLMSHVRLMRQTVGVLAQPKPS